MLSARLFLIALGLSTNLFAADMHSPQLAIQLLNRAAYGPTPAEVQLVSKIGADQWLLQQLNPSQIKLSSEQQVRFQHLDEQEQQALHRLPELAQAQRNKDNAEANNALRREVFRSLADAAMERRLIRATESPRQLEEVLTEFWFNHFNVFIAKGMTAALVGDYERQAIRPYVLGHFRDLLGATAKHPAMLFYLDNWQSIAPGSQRGKADGLNENYARELMELHTLGVDGGYSQQDVTELARMLTGWTFLRRDLVNPAQAFSFSARVHDGGSKQWLGQNIKANGQREGEAALDQLASHPSTAQHISYQLAQYFVADEPPKALVDRMAKCFLQTDGDLKAVTSLLLKSDEFWAAVQQAGRFKTPYRYVLSAIRASQQTITNGKPTLNTLREMGMPLYGNITPDGYKVVASSWLNPDALQKRIDFANAMANGRLPNRGEAAQPLHIEPLLQLYQPVLSSHTRQIIAAAPEGQQAALLLASPEFLRY